MTNDESSKGRNGILPLPPQLFSVDLPILCVSVVRGLNEQNNIDRFHIILIDLHPSPGIIINDQELEGASRFRRGRVVE